MKTITKFLMLSVLICFSITANATDKTFRWVLPTERVDGSPLTPGELASTNIYCDNLVQTLIVSPGFTEYTYNMPPGNYECFATVVDTDDLESDASNTIVFTVPKSPPRSPTSFSVD